MRSYITKLALVLMLASVLHACSGDDPTFGSSYDACILRHGANSVATKEICARHFSRSATQSEVDLVRSVSSVEVEFDQEPILPNGSTWDKITASIINQSDDLVVTKVRVTATFYADKDRTEKLPHMPLVWDLPFDPSDENSRVVGSFDHEKAPSRFYRAYVEPITVYSHTRHAS